MTKEELAAAMAAYERKGGKVEEVATGVSGRSELDNTVSFCNCGCYGDWTEHRMREAENGKFK